MKNTFVTRLAKSAAATVMVGAGVVPPHQATAALPPPVAAQELAFLNEATVPELESQASTKNFTLTVTQAPSEWSKGLEREFRKLALEEATGKISRNDMSRLEQLSHWRNQLLCPQSEEETLLQMKRDRLLARMENLLQEYVEFQEAANQTRTAA